MSAWGDGAVYPLPPAAALDERGQRFSPPELPQSCQAGEVIATAPDSPPSVACRGAPTPRPVRWLGAVIGLERAVVDERPALLDLDDQARVTVTRAGHHGRIIAPRDISEGERTGPGQRRWPGPAANTRPPTPRTVLVGQGHRAASGAVILDRDHSISQ